MTEMNYFLNKEVFVIHKCPRLRERVTWARTPETESVKMEPEQS